MPEDVPWLSLDPDESIVWSGTPRLFLVVHVAAVALLLPIVAIAIEPALWTALGGLAAWAAIVAAAVVYVRNVEYVASTDYLYAKRGVLSRSVTQVALRNVQNTTVRQGIFGVQFDHGTVAFSSAGSEGAQLRFLGIRGPLTAKARVDEQLARHGRSGGSGGEAGRAAGAESRHATGSGDAVIGVEDVLAEARAMRSAAERVDDAIATRRRADGDRAGGAQ